MKNKAELLKQRSEKLERMKAIDKAAEGRSLNDVEGKEYDSLKEEVRSLDDQLKRLSDIDSLTLEGDNGEDFRSKISGVQDRSDDDPKGGFRDLGHFVKDVYNLRKGIGMTDELRKHIVKSEQRAMSLNTGEEGGFAVPEQFVSEILYVKTEAAIVRPRARVIGADAAAPDAKVSIPALSQAADVYSGIDFNPVKDGQAGKENDPKLRMITLDPKKQLGTIDVGNDLLRNAAGMSSFLTGLLANAKAGREDHKFLYGSGVGVPSGFVTGVGRLVVTRKTASKFVYDDVKAMRKSILPGANVAWLVSTSALDQVMDLVDAGGHSLFAQGDISKAIPDRVAGIPVIYTNRAPALGTEGDVALLNFDYYLIKDGHGMRLDISVDVKFKEDQSVFRVSWGVDGDNWVNSPVKAEGGNYTMSSAVVLK